MRLDSISGISGRLPFVVALTGILLVAFYFRWDGLFAIGVGGNDTILYYSLAEQWLQGNFVFSIGDSFAVYRPVLLAFNALALKVFGHSDYAIKLANVLLDTVNLLLLSRLAWHLAGSRAVVLACAASYAMMPLAIWSARQELAHTISTFFALGAFLSIWRASLAESGRAGLIYAALAGGCVGAATLTHEDLIFLAAPLALFLFFASRFRGAVDSLSEDLRRLAAFCIGPLLAAAIVMFFESATVQAFVKSSIVSAGRDDRIFLEVFARFVWDGIVGSSSATMALYLAGALVFLGCKLVFPRVKPEPLFVLSVGFCIFTVLSFVFASAVFFGTFFPRGFLPLIPLALVAVFHSLAKMTGRLHGVLSGALLATAVVFLVLSNLASFSAFNVANRKFSSQWAEPAWPNQANLERGFLEFLIDAKYIPSYATHWRALFDALSDKVDDSHKILVMPSTVFYAAGRRALQTEVYFGDNAIYRLDHSDQTLQEVVKSHNVKWVVFTTGQLRGVPTRLGRYLYNGQWAEPQPLDLAEAYRLDEYSELRELEALLSFLKTAGAREVFPFPRGSFEARKSRTWLLP